MKKAKLAIAILVLMHLAISTAQVLGQNVDSPVLVVVSIDGLRPDYVTKAEQHGAKLPNLTRFLQEGVFAEGVTGAVSYTHLRARDA